MNDPLQDAGLGVDYIETAPADLEEDKHNVESMGTWLIAAIGLTCVGAAIGLALGGW